MWISQKFLFNIYTAPARTEEQIVRRDTIPETPDTMDYEETIQHEYITPAVSLSPEEEPRASDVESIYETLIPGFQPSPDETVTVVTESLVLTVASRGGKLIGWELPEYSDYLGDQVSLFPESYEGAFQLSVRKGGQVYNLHDLPFRLDVERSAGSGRAARIIWTARGDGGCGIQKILDIPDDGYTCRLDMRSHKLGIAGYELTFNPGLQVTEKNQKDDLSYFSLRAGIVGDPWNKKLGKIKEENPEVREGTLDWVGLRTKYFLAAVIPDSVSWHRIHSLGGSNRGEIGFTMEGLAAGGTMSEAFTVYLGPLEYDLVAPLGRGVTHAVDMGNRYLRPIGRVILLFLTKVHDVVPNYGIVIILFAITMKLILHPLTRKSMQSMKQMQELQPKLAAIKEKYKNNQQKQQEETMKLYREHGVNPLGGCLPLVVQMPIFFAMYPILRSSIYLRGATFIPGLITDLSQPNYGLPILMGITQFFSSRMMATGNQNKALTYGMPIFMTYIFFRFPSGLVLYWLIFNLLQIGQQLLQKRATRASGSG